MNRVKNILSPRSLSDFRCLKRRRFIKRDALNKRPTPFLSRDAATVSSLEIECNAR